jgi:hypothetical protein
MSNEQAVAQGREEAGSLHQRQEQELEEQLARLRSLQEHGDFSGARELVRQLEVAWPDSDRIRRQARTLAPPEVRNAPGVRGRSRQMERTWLREHACAHAGSMNLSSRPRFALNSKW